MMVVGLTLRADEMSIEAALATLAALPVPDRIRAVQALWDSIPEEQTTETLTDEQRQLFARRTAELDANPGIALTWEQIKARVKGQQ
jgi:putative addiction module component (TIGR02574 family)